MATAGDPLADAVVTELGLPARARQSPRQGPVDPDVPPTEVMTALLRQLEPPRIDPLMLHRGDIVSQSVPPMWFQLCSVPCALAHAFASPSVAHTLAGTGELAVVATRLLAEAGAWARQTLRPGGLLYGAPGQTATVRMRLLWARTRVAARAHGDATTPAGPPMTQADMARVWLGFTLVSYRALAAVGIDISSEEEQHLYQYWSYVAQLLGIDESLTRGVTSHTEARRVQDLLDSTTAAPDENSRALTLAMVDAQARAMAGAPGAVMDEDQVRAVIQRVLREALGVDAAERLGIPAPAATDLMPLIGRINRQARYWQTFSAASAGEARRRAIEGPGPELIAAVVPRAAAHRAPATAHGEGSLAA
ncbi:oxygenase MpaB family protein [Streptomyces sp. YKOK-I1]